MKTTLISLVLLLFTTVASAEALKTLELPANRVLGYHSEIQDGETGPVLVLMPGIFRGYYAKEPFLKILKQAKISYVAFHFAEQPESVARTGKEAPDFSKVTAKDLAQEVSALVDELEITQPLPVTLSYSAVVTQHLNVSRFPFVIETAPIGKDTDGLPDTVAQFYAFWEAWLKTIPFYGEIWLKQTKEYHLRNHWTPTVEEYAAGLPILKQPQYKERAVQGYISLTRSSEGFHLARQDFAKGPFRYFIIGQNEDNDRLRIQSQAIEKYQKDMEHRDNVYVIKGAGHIVPNDQPKAFAEILGQIRDEIGQVSEPFN